jgi:hypothetical protein
MTHAPLSTYALRMGWGRRHHTATPCAELSDRRHSAKWPSRCNSVGKDCVAGFGSGTYLLPPTLSTARFRRLGEGLRSRIDSPHGQGWSGRRRGAAAISSREAGAAEEREDLASLTRERLHTPKAKGAGSVRRPCCRKLFNLLRLIWWTAGGSNPRPLHCERSALPAELAARLVRHDRRRALCRRQDPQE